MEATVEQINEAFAGLLPGYLNMGPNTRTNTVESKTNFLKAAKIGTRVTATCKLVNRGRTMALLMTELRDPDNRLLAVVSQSQIMLPA